MVLFTREAKAPGNARTALPASSQCQYQVDGIKGLLVELGAELSEREGARIGVRLFGERRVFHRPHPSPNTDKGAVAAIREWLSEHGVKP